MSDGVVRAAVFAALGKRWFYGWTILAVAGWLFARSLFRDRQLEGEVASLDDGIRVARELLSVRQSRPPNRP